MLTRKILNAVLWRDCERQNIHTDRIWASAHFTTS